MDKKPRLWIGQLLQATGIPNSGSKGLMVVVGSHAIDLLGRLDDSSFPLGAESPALHDEIGNVIERQMAAQDLGDTSRIDAEAAMSALIQARDDEDAEVRSTGTSISFVRSPSNR